MNRAPLILILAGVILIAAFGLWISYKGPGKVPAANSASTVRVKPPTPVPTFPNSIQPNDWQEFRSDREATLHSNPKLVSEYEALLTEMDNQQKALEAAMVKANPKVAPVVAKLEAFRKMHLKPPVGTAIGKLPPGAPTQDEMTEIQAARLAAIKANPDFDVKARQLAAKLRAFEQKLTAAMVQADPKVAIVLSKMGEPPQAGTMQPTAAAPVKQ